MFAQVYAGTGELPQNRGKLFAAFVDTLLERERQRHPDGWPGAEVLIDAYADAGLCHAAVRRTRHGRAARLGGEAAAQMADSILSKCSTWAPAQRSWT